jgi:hypothetical protein
VFKVAIDFNEINADQIREYAVSMANIYSGDLQSGVFAVIYLSIYLLAYVYV